MTKMNRGLAHCWENVIWTLLGIVIVVAESGGGRTKPSKPLSSQLILRSSYTNHDFDSHLSDFGTAEARGAKVCLIPGRWEGRWFQSGVRQTISINSSTISTKGKCLETEGDKFLLYNELDKCYKCIVFHEKHLNVLQYKETYCIKDKKPLRDACSKITGDAYLYSMFRLDGSPVECPFQGPFVFTYNRGHGECKYPLSKIDSCIQPSRLLFSYQACPDVSGTESSIQDLQCLAKWKEGSSKYLLGLIQYTHHASYEERFRCFVYEKRRKGGGFNKIYGNNNFNLPNTSASTSTPSDAIYRISQSGDATCNGLSSTEGSKTLIVKKAPTMKPCQFPSWVQLHAQWHTLNQRSTFSFESSTLRIHNVSDLSGIGPKILTTRATCSQILENPTLDKVMLVLHATTECRSGYICTALYRRDGHIVEMQMGSIARKPEDACHTLYFNHTSLPFITLVSSTPETRQCPNLGQFSVTGLLRNGIVIDKRCEQGFTTLRVGCSSLDTMEFQSTCVTSNIIAGLSRGEYSCHGSWEELGISYLITTPVSRASNSARRYCFVYKESVEPMEGGSSSIMSAEESTNSLKSRLTKNGFLSIFSPPGDTAGIPLTTVSPLQPKFRRVLHFSRIAESCRRDVEPGVQGTFAFNVTSHGHCNDINGASKEEIRGMKLFEMFMLIVAMGAASFFQLSDEFLAE